MCRGSCSPDHLIGSAGLYIGGGAHAEKSVLWCDAVQSILFEHVIQLPDMFRVEQSIAIDG